MNSFKKFLWRPQQDHDVETIAVSCLPSGNRTGCMHVSVHAVLVPACCKTLSRHAQCITILDASPGPTKRPAAALRHTVDLAVKNVMGRSV